MTKESFTALLQSARSLVLHVVGRTLRIFTTGLGSCRIIEAGSGQEASFSSPEEMLQSYSIMKLSLEELIPWGRVELA